LLLSLPWAVFCGFHAVTEYLSSSRSSGWTVISRRHPLEPWASSPARIKRELPVEQCFRAPDDRTAMIQVVGPDTAFQYDQGRLLQSGRGKKGTALVLIEADDNDLAQWLPTTSAQHLNGVLHLNVHHNDLSDIKAVSACADLRTLDASSNEVRGTLDQVHSRTLTWLSLANNSLRGLGSRAGPFPSLEYLDVASNDLQTLRGLQSAGGGSPFPVLRALDASNNDLTDVHELVAVGSTLQALALDSNELGDSQAELLVTMLENGAFPNLKFLSCEDNNWSDAAEQRLERAFEGAGVDIWT